MEVLNTENVNSSNEIVLNDRKLCELVLQYPFLFSPEVHPFGDVDYDEWAWENITVEFNSSYDASCLIVFTMSELQQRWHGLQSIVLGLMNNLNDIPGTFQSTVKKIGMLLQMPEKLPPQPTVAQTIVLDNINMVEKLSLTQRRSLEAEVMELILKAEIKSKSTLKMGPLEEQRLERECQEFLNTIGFKQVFKPDDKVLAHSDDSDSTNSASETQNKSTSNKIDEVLDCSSTSSASSSSIPISLLKCDAQKNQCDSKQRKRANSVDQPSGTDVKRARIEDDDHAADDALLEPIGPKKYIPVELASMYIRKCMVRVKRCRIPRRRIKQERFSYNW